MRTRAFVSLLGLCFVVAGLMTTAASASAAAKIKLGPVTLSQPPAPASVPGTGDTTSSAVGDTSAVADSTQLVDISHQLNNIQKKIAQLQAEGQYAQQGQLSTNATCGFEEPSQVFLPWGDLALYALTTQNSLDDWSLGNVAVGSDDDPYSAGPNSFSFAAGNAQATTPTMCVNLQNPTIRLFLKDVGGNAQSDLKVSVIYEGIDGKMSQLTIAKLQAGSTWQPSVVIPIGVNILSAASQSGVTAVAFQFQPEHIQKGETWTIDNVYVDPFCSH